MGRTRREFSKMSPSRMRATFAGLTAVAVVGAIVAGSPAAPSETGQTLAQPSATVAPVSSATPSADQIYLMAVRVTRGLPVPKYVYYRLHIVADNLNITRKRNPDGTESKTLEFTRNANHKQSDYMVWYRSVDDTALMQNVATAAKTLGPPVPWSITTQSSGENGGPWNSASPAASVNPAASPSATPSAADQGTKMIGEITVSASRFYDIALVGIESVNVVQAYHLKLKARADRTTHPLTDLFVDPMSYRVVRAIAYYAVGNPLDGFNAVTTLDFSASGPYWVVTSGRIDAAARMLLLHAHGDYDFQATVLGYPESLPDSYFVASTG